MTEKITAIVAEKNNFVAKSTGEEMMLVPLKNEVVELNQFLTLNEVGTFIWESIESEDTLDSIAVKVCTEFDAEKQEVLTDVSAFIEHLHQYMLPQ